MRLCKHCCGKAININFCVRVRAPRRVVHVALLIEHATRMRHILTSFMARLAPLYFSTLSHKRHDKINKIDKIKHTFCVQWLLPENHAVCEKMSKNMAQPGRSQKIRTLLVACYISKATHTQKYVIFTAFHGKNGFVNAPQRYVTHALPVLFSFFLFQRFSSVLRYWSRRFPIVTKSAY